MSDNPKGRRDSIGRAVMLTLAAACLMVGQAQAAPPVTPAITAALRDALDKELVDYPHARFREVYIQRDPDGTYLVCGKVNGPNALGGFTGWMSFLGGSAKGGGAFVSISNDQTMSDIADKTCDVRSGPDYAAAVTYRRGR